MRQNVVLMCAVQLDACARAGCEKRGSTLLGHLEPAGPPQLPDPATGGRCAGSAMQTAAGAEVETSTLERMLAAAPEAPAAAAAPRAPAAATVPSSLPRCGWLPIRGVPHLCGHMPRFGPSAAQCHVLARLTQRC